MSLISFSIHTFLFPNSANVCFPCTTACHTYADVIEQVNRPGTPLHEGWANLAAPDMAIAYWKLPQDAKFVDTLKCMVSHHF